MSRRKFNAETIQTTMNQFEINQNDLSLDDLQILWTGQYVQLYKRGNLNGNPLTTLTASGDIVQKVIRWCVKNNYRCSQIRGGRILL